MRTHAPFRPDDLEELDGLLDQATAVVSMGEVYAGATHRSIIGLRHDVDNAIEPAVEMAAWEQNRGYRATYYILHTAPYWDNKPLLERSLALIAGCGHEIGIHNNALAESSRTGEDPRLILASALIELQMFGYEVTGTVAHGDQDCYGPDGRVAFVNDQMFTECVRPDFVQPMRTDPLVSFGLDYDANWLGRGAYLSDSGGRWSTPFQAVAAGFPYAGQLHILVHPDWWGEAFTPAVIPVTAVASLWFVMPAHGRVELAAICMAQLQRTCEALRGHGIDAACVVVSDDDNLDTAGFLEFGTVKRDNRFLARKYNDGIQFALDPEFNPRPADYVVPIGSDDWVDHRLFLNLPPPDTVMGFRHVAFVNEDASEISETRLAYEGGVGIRVYPRQLLEPTGYRPADEDRKRACDTSILWNTRRAWSRKHNRDIRVMYGDQHSLQIVDWKTPGEQMNRYDQVTSVHRSSRGDSPFERLRLVYPAGALEAMENHYKEEAMSSYRNRHIDGYHDPDEKVREEAPKAEAKRVKSEEKKGTKTASTTSADVAGLTK